MVCLPSLVPGIRLACPNSRELPSTDKEKVNGRTAERAVCKADTQEGRGARVDLCGKTAVSARSRVGGAERCCRRERRGGPRARPRNHVGPVNFNVVSLLSKTPPRRIKTEWNHTHSKEQQRTSKEEIRCNEEVKRSRG